jgi:hypothetical protein
MAASLLGANFRLQGTLENCPQEKAERPESRGMPMSLKELQARRWAEDSVRLEKNRRRKVLKPKKKGKEEI